MSELPEVIRVARSIETGLAETRHLLDQIAASRADELRWVYFSIALTFFVAITALVVATS